MICLRLVLQTTDIKSKYNLESRNVLKIYYILCVIYLSQSQFCIQIFTTYVAPLFLLLFLGTHQHESICVYRTARQIERRRSNFRPGFFGTVAFKFEPILAVWPY